MSWFDDARFGMFVHWDHASQQGLEVSWPLVGGVFALPYARAVGVEQYHASAATFDPKQWDADALAGLAKRTGMRYAILTAKHHSGYAMFHTRYSQHSIQHSPFGRDIVAEFCDAMRGAGLRVGLYFSLSDWSHPDYPAFTEQHKPYRFGQSPPMPDPHRWERFVGDMLGQIRELLTNYGPIDVLWFDGGWERPPEAWKPREVEALARELQPEILLNDRLPGVGDYATPEQFVPPQPPPGRWETCMTMNETWGYNPADTSYKPARRLIHTLCETAAKGGNFLLNVSPTGAGSLPAEQVERLETIGSWMARHGASIHATTPGLDAWQHYGPSTRRADTVYLHLLMRPYESVTIRGVPIKRVAAVRDLASGRPLRHETRTGIVDRLMDDPAGELTVEVPADLVNEHATVIEVTFGS